MTLKEAVDKIMGEALTWVEANGEVRPEWTKDNFPGMFLYACSKELPQTKEIGALYTYQRRQTFSSRYLTFNIRGNRLTMVKVHPYDSRYNMGETIGALNKAFEDVLFDYMLNGLKPEYIRNLLDKVDRTRGKGYEVEKPIVHDIRRIEAFNFKPTERFVKL